MYLANFCNHPGCQKIALSTFSPDGTILEEPGFCLEHSENPEKVARDIISYIQNNDKIVGLVACYIEFNELEHIDLTDKRFYGCNFMHCIFRGFKTKHLRSRMTTFDDCIFSDCNFLESNLQYTSFAGSKFSHVLLTNSELIQDNFVGIESYQTSFDDSDLYNSRFINAKLFDTSIRNCNIKNTVFRNIEQTNLSFNLSNTKEAIFDERGSALFTGMQELDNPIGART